MEGTVARGRPRLVDDNQDPGQRETCLMRLHRRDVPIPDYSYRRERGERRVLLRQKLWQNPSAFRFDSVYHLSFCVGFANLFSITSLRSLRALR